MIINQQLSRHERKGIRVKPGMTEGQARDEPESALLDGLEDDRSRSAQLLVEFLPETPDQRLLEELIDTDAFTLSFFKSIGTDVPMMNIESQHTIGKLLDPYRVQSTGYRFPERTLAGKETALYGTEAVVVLIKKSIGALFGARDKRSHSIPFDVNLEEAL